MRRPVRSGLSLALLATAALVGSGSPAAAAPGCDRPAQPGEVIAAVPWPQRLFGPDRVWQFSRGGVPVAVIDSGTDDDHPQLRGTVLPGRDYLNPGGDGTLDCASHGTEVASLIAAQPVDGVGFRGLAPDAKILPIRVTDQEPTNEPASGQTVSEAGLATAIDDAVKLGAKVINLSLVLYRDDSAVRAAVARAVAADIVVVAAAGNGHDATRTGPDPTPYPAGYDGVIGVGAINQDGGLLAASQVGPYVDLVAPGEAVVAATRVSGHRVVDGTSFATPLVAATAALVRAAFPRLSAGEVERQLVATADPGAGPAESGFGAGVVDPYRAVTEQLADQATGPLAVAKSPPAAKRSTPRRTGTPLVALWAALGGLALVAALAAGAWALPTGRRRRWRAGRASAVPTIAAADDVPTRSLTDLFSIKP